MTKQTHPPPIVASSSNAGAAQERIAGTLRGGVYYLRVGGSAGSATVPCLLRISTSPAPDPAFATAYNLGALSPASTGIAGGTLIDADGRDYYRLTLSSPATVSLTLKSFAGNADLQFIHDANNNGVLDAGEILATSARPSGLDSIARTLSGGTYYIRISRGGAAGAAYDLTIEA